MSNTPTDIEAARAHFVEALGLMQAGNFAAAEVWLREALALAPQRISVLTNLAAVQLHLGKMDEALAHAERSLRLDPDNVEGLLNAASASIALGHHDPALTYLNQVLAHQPGNMQARMSLGRLKARQGRHDEARAYFQRVIELDPSRADAHYHLGHTFMAVQRFENAQAHYERATTLRPDDAPMHLAQGNALYASGQARAALLAYDRVIAIDPCCAEAHSNRGNALRDLRRHGDAALSYGRAIALNGDFAAARANRGSLLRAIGEPDKALADFAAAIRLEPASAAYRLQHLVAQIPLIAADAAAIARSRAAFACEARSLLEWIKTNPDAVDPEAVGLAQPFYLAYQEQDNSALMQSYGAICAALMSRWRDAGNQPRQARPTHAGQSTQHGRGRRIRVGIATAYIGDHPAWNAFVKDWVEQLDRSKFDVRLYQLSSASNEETRRLAQSMAALTSGNKPLRDWVAHMQADDNQVLIYPELGMDAMAVRLASLRIAPVQVASWGHPETSGLPTIDYYLSAADFESDAAGACYSERLITLPNLGAYCETPPAPAAVALDESLSFDANRPLLLCAGTPFKYSPLHDTVFVEIVRRVPHALFLFFEFFDAPMLTRKLMDRLTTHFTRAGLNWAQHARVIPWQNRPQFHALLRRADVYLDTIGFSGFNSALQAIEHGLPIVTREGQYLRGRFGCAIAKRLNLPELVAKDDTAYADIAARLALDRSWNLTIRDRMARARHGLYRDRSVIDALEAFLHRVAADAGAPTR